MSSEHTYQVNGLPIPKDLRPQHEHAIERLRELYAMMFGVPDERVDLKNWTSTGSFSVRSCGTAACAVGWATEYPPFIEQGLRMGDGQPEFGRRTNWGAVHTFFGIGDEVGSYLFCVGSQWNPFALKCEGRGKSDKKQVLQRIRTVLLAWHVITKERSDELATQEEAL